jgi:NAD(P)-dependent dehydrogenase (short-subunit alcohol dehydrogenase family)
MVSAYVASKFAVLGFSKSLRVELEPHRIGVTAICPGTIATAIFDDSRKAGNVQRRRDAIATAFKRGAAPAIVARAILAAVKVNPAVRTVGIDAVGLAALTWAAPNLSSKLGSLFAKRFARP